MRRVCCSTSSLNKTRCCASTAAEVLRLELVRPVRRRRRMLKGSRQLSVVSPQSASNSEGGKARRLRRLGSVPGDRSRAYAEHIWSQKRTAARSAPPSIVRPICRRDPVLKAAAKSVLPQSAVRAVRRLWPLVRRFKGYLPAGDVQGIFSKVYSDCGWGGTPGDFFSGEGSRGETARAYIEVVGSFIRAQRVSSVVDLGCGDFHIGRHVAMECATYIGADIVPALIECNVKRFSGAGIQFVCLDASKDPLPDADLCLVRQMLQHLSNRQVRRILRKLRKYENVIITEHQPPDDQLRGANFNKPPGGDTRLFFGSGVYLDRSPYNLDVRLLLEVPAPAPDMGYIRTFLWMPARREKSRVAGNRTQRAPRTSGQLNERGNHAGMRRHFLDASC
jgi:SAM-dependent methyltransferase